MLKMYVNFGDRNFLERGRLVLCYVEFNDDGSYKHIEPCNDDGYIKVIYCEPYCDCDKYIYDECSIDVYDTWISSESIHDFAGGCDTEIDFALACLDYYGSDEFSDYYNRDIYASQADVINYVTEQLHDGYIFYDIENDCFGDTSLIID